MKNFKDLYPSYTTGFGAPRALRIKPLTLPARRAFPTIAMLSLAALIALVPNGAHAADLSYGFNIFGVSNGGPNTNSGFIVTGNGWNVTQLVTYHWNNGLGTRTAGNISLYNASGSSLSLIGTFPAIGEAGQGGVPNANWVANVPNKFLPAGIYRVTDSEPWTWSQNAQSGGLGFLIVRGTVAAAPSAPSTPSTPSTPSSPAQPSVPYGGNCRGAGCTHPNLRPYGGNGPYMFGAPTVSLHRSHAGSFVFFDQLSPYTTFAAESQKCSSYYRGSLILLDDEPWYYYFSGYWATVGCHR
jgi:hypothetical protein